MSLAATLAASGVRPASFIPTVKCSSCGDEIEISAMGEHTCSQAPASPKTAPASWSNPFTLRQINASENKPAMPSPLQFNASETRPAQPSPLQFSADENKPAQPSPLQFNSSQAQMRSRAPTAGSTSLSIPKASRPAPPRINPEAANQPFLGPAPPTPLSPSSSVRSGSSNSSRNTQPRRAMTTPMPRLWDPRPPSPELSANLDCAFPPFPTPAITQRKASTASQSSSRSGSRPDLHSKEPRSPIGGPGETMVNTLKTMRSGSLGQNARRPSAEDRSPREMSPFDRRPSPHSEPLSPLEENPIARTLTASPVDMPLLSPAISTTSQPESQTPPLQREPSQKRVPPQRPPRPDEPLPSTLAPNSTLNRQPSQLRIPPVRPARPEEGIPDALLNPISLRTFSQRRPRSPAPAPLQNLDRSQTVPLPPRTNDEYVPSPTLSKMASEPALRSTAGVTDTAQSQQETDAEDSRLDPRIQDAPPVPKPVQQLHRESLHKSSESGASTASSMMSMGNFSLENSNTTAEQSPVVSAASSLDVFSPFAAEAERERQGEDEELHVPALNIKSQPQTDLREEPQNDSLSLQVPASPLISGIARPHDDSRQDDLRSPSLPATPGISSWPLESPMDPALHDGKLQEDKDVSSPIVTPLEVTQPTLAPESPKLERLSSAVYDPKRPFSSASKSEPESRPRSGTNAASPFEGFNFGSPFSSQLDLLDSAASSRKPSESDYSSRKPSESDQSSRKPSDSGLSITEPPQVSRNGTSPTPDHLPVPENFPLPPMPQETPRPALMRRGTVGARATCRGCKKQIEGKSVKAADGRLTGRWHKACFVCQTCKQAFTTADFYVINNQPYCEQHYHEKNGSVCHGCRTGIEGQFLEIRSGPDGNLIRKYHRRCFTCVDCRVVLSEDYFEIAGRIHCERHALAAMRSQARRASPPGAPALPHGGSGLKAESFKTERRRSRLVET